MNGAADDGIVPGQPDGGGGLATPSFALPAGAGSGLPGDMGETRFGRVPFRWGSRTFVMGIVNVTPDSFSGDGLLAERSPAGQGLEQARRMVEEGADIIDVGGESTRPGHAPVDAAEEAARVVPIVRSIRAAVPEIPISVDTVKADVAAAALDAGADAINDVWGVDADPALLRMAADRGVPLILMHNRREARYTTLLPEIIADLQAAIARALDAGVRWENLLIDPGFGFGKTPEHNLALLRDLESLRLLGRPIVLGTSRKSTLGRVLDLPPDQRVEATAATTVLGIRSGVDVVRVHDVRPNVRAARMADAVVRGSR